MVEVQHGETLLTLDLADWEAQVRAGRIPPEALIRFGPVTGRQFRPAATLEMYAALRDERILAWRDRWAAAGPPVATAALVGVQVKLWSLAQLPSWREPMERSLTRWTPPVLEDGEVWRLLTMGFFHTNFVHVAMNLLWLAWCAAHLERALGPWRLVLLYVTTVLTGSVFATFAAPENPSLGASGGVFGLIATAVVFGMRHEEVLPERTRRFFGFGMLPYLIVMFGLGLTHQGTDNACHFGGLVGGAVLGMLMEPRGLERAPGRELRIDLGLAAASSLTLLVLALAGPRLELLRDAEQVRDARSVEPEASSPFRARTPPYRSLIWVAPGGWVQAVTVGSDVGLAAPTGVRAFAVTEELTDRASTPFDDLATFVAAAERGGSAIRMDPPEPTILAGRPAWHARGMIDLAEAPQAVDWYLSRQGRWRLQAVWQTEADTEARTRPLRDRMLAAITWSEPVPLHNAAADLQKDPASAERRRRHAQALTDAGQVEVAWPVWEALLNEGPTRPEAWQGLIGALPAFPTPRPDTDAWLERALAADLGPKVDAAVANALRLLGREAEALGVLEHAWRRAPGDTTLRPLRAALHLTVRLDDRGQPWSGRLALPDLTWLQSEPAQPGPTSLSDAAPSGQRLLDTRQQLRELAAAQVAGDLPGLGTTLLLLNEPSPVVQPVEALEALLSVLDGEIAPWWWSPSMPAPSALAEALRGQGADRALSGLPAAPG